MTDFLGRAAGWFGRLLDGVNLESGATRVGLLALGLLLAVVGIAWVRRISNPGPLARGEAAWRYRDHRRFDLLGEGSTFPGDGETRGWWATRIEFGIAIVLLLLVAPFALITLITQVLQMGGGPGNGPWALAPAAGYAGMLVGLWWMVRIYRAGLRNDAEATWRHRDRRR